MIEFDSYVKIFCKNGKTEFHNKSAVKIEISCLKVPRVQELKQYLVAISNCANRSDGQDSVLSRELESIAFISDETVFADYSLGKTIEPGISTQMQMIRTST